MTSWHPQALAPNTEKALKLLSKQSWLNDFYLAGGTGLALQFGHRISVDLDFFTTTNRLDGENRRRFLHRLSQTLSFKLDKQEEGTVHGVLSQTHVSFLKYPYVPLKPLKKWEGILIAAPEDIGLMKLVAIEGRGSKKDFIDLYVLAHQGYSLTGLFELSIKKFSHSRDYFIQILKALTYFQDAESSGDSLQTLQEIPRWERIKEFFQSEAGKLIKKFLT